MSDESLPSGLAGRMAAIAEKNQKSNESNQKLAKKIEKELRTEPEQLTFQMPLIPNEMTAIPRGWARGSLFSNVQPGKRRRYVEEILPSRAGSEILYTGSQLDMADSDVFLYAVILATGKKSGEKISFVRAHFLEAINRQAGNTGYKWLHESLKRLRSATLFLENSRGDGRAYNLIKELEWSTKLDRFWIELDPEVVRYYSENEIAYIDFETRLRLKTPLAKWLQNYVCSHQIGAWHHISVDNLRVWSNSGSMKNFVATGRGLPKALEELAEHGVIENFEFYERKVPGRGKERMVRWWRSSDLAQSLMAYIANQPSGWHVVDAEALRGPSQYRTLKSFLASGKGLRRALNELEKAQLIEKSEIFSEPSTTGKTVIRVRWWTPENALKKLSTTIGIAEPFQESELA